MSFIKELDQFADYIATARPSITVATVAVTERTVRRVLRLKKKDALAYRGLTLKCVGSKRWRAGH